MRYSTRYPRHLSARSPRERGAVIGQLSLIAITIVIGGLLAMAVTRHGEPAATQTPVAPGAESRPTSPPPTAGTPATAPAASAPAGGSPASSGTPAVGGGNTSNNLLANPGFEEGLDGWSAIGGAKLDLADESREGSLALNLTAGGGRAPGVSARHVTESEAHRSYTASAWVRATRPGTTAELNLVEYVGQRRLSTDTSGAVLPGGGWQRLEVTHVTHQPGSELAVEVVVPDLAQRAGVALDDLQVRLGSSSDAFTPETTSR
jgi:Carbohydrate binding domain